MSESEMKEILAACLTRGLPLDPMPVRASSPFHVSLLYSFGSLASRWQPGRFPTTSLDFVCFKPPNFWLVNYDVPDDSAHISYTHCQ